MSFAERQRHLLQTGEFSDFVMTVDGRDFAIHRNIVCPQSTVLHRLITGNFKEGREGRGTLAEANADIFEKVLKFIYTGEYDSPTNDAALVPGNDTDETASLRQQSEQLMEHTEVYLLAKYLDISQLMRHATSRFAAVASQNFRADACVEAFSRVFNHGSDGDSGLRAQILKLCLENSERLSPDGEPTLLLLEHEPIAWKMVLRQAHEHTSLVEALVQTQRFLEDALQKSQETIKALKQKAEEKTTDRDPTLMLLEKTDKCRNCDKDFGSYVDQQEGGIVRCKGCRCRHYLTPL